MVERDRNGRPHGSGVALILVAVLLGIVFVVDAATHVGLAAGMFYVPVVLIASQLTTPRAVVLAAGVAIVLTVIGALLSDGVGSVGTAYVAGNRAIACLAIAACGWFGAAMLRTREQLERSNARLTVTQQRMDEQTRLLEIAGDVGRFGGWSVDVRTQQMRLSDEVAAIRGLASGTPHAMTEGTLNVVPEDRERIREAFYRCAADGTPFDVEVQLVRHTDDALRWVNVIGRADRDDAGAVTYVHGALQDITDRIEAQLDAESHRRRLEMMGDAMPFVMWTSTPNGDIDYLSEEFWRITGMLPSDSLGDAWLAVVHPDDRGPSMERWHAALATGEPYEVDFRARTIHGYRWVLTRAVPERAADGSIARWWGSSLDVHDLRTLEQESTALAKRLNDTLESIGDAVLALDTQWRVAFVNSHAERLLQHKREDLLGRDIWSVFPEAVGSVFQQEYERAVTERRPVAFSAPFAPLGIEAEISAYPSEHGLTIYFRDVSQHRTLGEPQA